MWRPFTSQFVTHCFRSFSKHEARAFEPHSRQKSPGESVDLNKLFPNNTPQAEVEERQRQFVELQERLEGQRAMIKLRDRMHEQRLKRRKQCRRQLLMDKQLKRRGYFAQIRAMANNTVKSRSVANSPIFALTATQRGGTNVHTPRISLKNPDLIKRNVAEGIHSVFLFIIVCQVD